MTPLTLSPEVEDALATCAPVVALESTIITHGMPWPRNLDLAREVEADLRGLGTVPATIAVLEGRLHVGLSDAQLESLAQESDAAKLSRADLAVCMARGGTGSTTVAATMIAAARAGIHVFATGGIGGVHRGAEHSFDISADLQELAQTPVTVVAAGPKAILDVPKTLEVLETLGVPVIAFGQDNVPAFWSAQSAHPAPLRMDSAKEIARAHRMRRALDLPGGQLVANPVAAEDEIPRAEMEPIVARALQEAEAAGIRAKEVTPWLLSRIYDLTEGRSLEANIALMRGNARLAARIATALATDAAPL